MTEKEILKIFKDEKALLSGHFLLSSGLHSPNYMQCALLLQKPPLAETLCRALAKKISLKIDVVIGPALGGMIVAHEMGRALKARSVFAERVPASPAGGDGNFVLRRGFELRKNEKVLVVEDVVTTGKSTREVMAIAEEKGAEVAGVAALVDRSDGAAVFLHDFYSLLKIHIPVYKPGDCPLCRAGKAALTKPGSRGLKTEGERS